MKFDPKEILECIKLFNEGRNTSEVQEYLMDKYNCLRCNTSNFVKLIRRRMGIYKSIKKFSQVISAGRASH